MASRRAFNASSTACLTTLIAAPAAGRASAVSLPKPFIASVNAPLLPRYLAFAFSRSVILTLALKSAMASGIKCSKFCILLCCLAYFQLHYYSLVKPYHHLAQHSK